MIEQAQAGLFDYLTLRKLYPSRPQIALFREGQTQFVAVGMICLAIPSLLSQISH
jgi:hypothetical protein